MKKNLLIISAHADDHLACAGTVFKLQEEFGYQAFEVVLTDSSLGQDFKIKRELSPQVVAQTRKKELSEASRFLGVKKTFQFNQPDLGLCYQQALVFELIKIIREVRPQIAFLLHPEDAHPDHQVAYKLGLDALKIAATGVKKESLGTPWRTNLVLLAEGMVPVKAQILVDIRNYLEKKIKLFKIYASQASPRAVSFAQSLAVVRGYHLRKENSLAAEAFCLQEEFPVVLFEKDEKGLF